MTRITVNTEAIKKAVQLLGGNTGFILKTQVSYQSVLDWKSGRRTPNPYNCIKIEEATNGQVTRQEILPNFDWGKNMS